MIASLMMYKRPEIADEIGRYWELIRQELAQIGVNAPRELSQNDEEFSVWQAPDLVLAQTCGMPYRTRLHREVTLIGTPDFGVKNCRAGYYRSAFLVRRDDPRQGICDYKQALFAYNQRYSHSGVSAPYHHARNRGFWFENVVESGAHLDSAKMVAQGRADIAALDGVTWRLIERYDDFAEELRVLCWTDQAPALPYISAIAQQKQPDMFDAISKAISGLSEKDRDVLGLKSLIYIAPEQYLATPNPPEDTV